MEAAISAGVKAGQFRLDLGMRTEGAVRDYEDLVFACAAARPPPLPPDEVRRRLEHEKKFTAGSDVEVVDKLYRAFFEGVTGHATVLNFRNLEWGDAQGRQLAAVLPRFAALEVLSL